MARKRKNLMVDEEHDEWLEDKADELGVDQSFLVRRAIDYYRTQAIKKDKTLKQVAGVDDP